MVRECCALHVLSCDLLAGRASESVISLHYARGKRLYQNTMSACTVHMFAALPCLPVCHSSQEVEKIGYKVTRYRLQSCIAG